MKKSDIIKLELMKYFRFEKGMVFVCSECIHNSDISAINDKCLVEVEVKISKSDFRREFEAATLKNGTFMLQIHIEGTDLVTCTALIAMAVIVWSITRK